MQRWGVHHCGYPGSGYFPYLRFDNGGARHGFVSGVYKGALVMSFLLLSL